MEAGGWSNQVAPAALETEEVGYEIRKKKEICGFFLFISQLPNSKRHCAFELLLCWACLLILVFKDNIFQEA